MKIKYYLKKFFSKAIKIKKDDEVYEDYFYEAYTGCKNCGNNFWVVIKKGYYIKDMIKLIKCPKCKCRIKEE